MLLVFSLLVGCIQQSEVITNDPSGEASNEKTETVRVNFEKNNEDMFTDRDGKIDYDENKGEQQKIQCQNHGIFPAQTVIEKQRKNENSIYRDIVGQNQKENPQISIKLLQRHFFLQT